jgi:hypothetical protein
VAVEINASKISFSLKQIGAAIVIQQNKAMFGLAAKVSLSMLKEVLPSPFIGRALSKRYDDKIA